MVSLASTQQNKLGKKSAFKQGAFA